MLEEFLNIIFPKKCLKCGEQGDTYLCDSCFLTLGMNFKIINIQKEYYEYLVYLEEYKDEIRSQLLKFKFYDEAYINEYFLEFLLKDSKVCNFIKKFDIVIPVPMYKTKKLKRGYNQTELLGKNLSKKIKLNYAEDVLIKFKENETQSLLDKESRENNVKNVFEIQNSNKIYGKKVILIDDIYTTGSTISECSKRLKEAGAQKICALVIAKK